MTLSELVRVAARGYKVIAASVMVALALGGIALLLIPPQYESAALIYVNTVLPPDATEEALEESVAYTNYRTITFKELVGSDLVLAPVTESLDLDMTTRELAQHVTSLSALNTAIIEIIVSWSDPEEAALIANTIADQAVDQFKNDLSSQLVTFDISVAQRAVAASSATSPNPGAVLGFGALAGLLAGLAIVFARHALSPRFHAPRDLMSITAAPIIGMLHEKRHIAEDQHSNEVARVALNLHRSVLSANGALRLIAPHGDLLPSDLADAVSEELPRLSAQPALVTATSPTSSIAPLEPEPEPTGAVVVVVTYGESRIEQITLACEQFEREGTPIAGFIVMNAPTRGPDAAMYDIAV